MNELPLPKENEYHPFYKDYIDLVIEADIKKLLEQQIYDIKKYYIMMGEEKSGQGYAAGKWTAKELLGHILDTDRIMTFRALCIARGDMANLPGFDQDQYVAAADFNNIPLSSLLEDWELSRKAMISLFKNLPQSSFANTGNANNSVVSVRALFYIIAGNTQHHLQVLRERYV